jgi:hypothetical protein
MAQQPNPSRTKAESTTAGEQHVILDAEKVSDAEVAKRKAGRATETKGRTETGRRRLVWRLGKPADLVDLAGKPTTAKPANYRSFLTT